MSCLRILPTRFGAIAKELGRGRADGRVGGSWRGLGREHHAFISRAPGRVSCVYDSADDIGRVASR